MKKIILLLVVASTFLINSCNVFDWADTVTDHFDLCKQLSDRGELDDAITECKTALDEAKEAGDTELQEQINVELADIYLAKSGIDIGQLVDVFVDNSDVSPVFTFVDTLINDIYENDTDIDTQITNAEEAVQYFDAAAQIGGYTDFGGLLAHFCRFALLLAKADMDERGDAAYEGDGKLEPEDICDTPSNATYGNCGTTITIGGAITEDFFCVEGSSTSGTVTFSNPDCGGISNDLALQIYNEFVDIGDWLSSLLGVDDAVSNVDGAVNSLLQTNVSVNEAVIGTILGSCTATVVGTTVTYTGTFDLNNDGTTCQDASIDVPSETLMNALGISIEAYKAGAVRYAVYKALQSL